MGKIPIVFCDTGASFYLCTMATRFVYKPSGRIFSSSIGDLEVSTDSNYVDVKLTAAGNLILLSERFYAFNGYFVLHDIASLIEAHMRKFADTIADFTISLSPASSPNSASDSCTLQIFYCDRLFNNVNIVDILKENFLTTLDYRRIAPDATISLFLFAQANESFYLRFHYTYKTPDEETLINTYSPNYVATASASRVLQFDIACDTLLNHAALFSGYKKSEISLLSFTAEAGQRAMTFFIDTNLRHTETFLFRNCFNVWDFFSCRMETTVNSETERELAIINNSKLFYDQASTKSYEVETGPLTSGESEWIDQLFTSYDVMRIEVNPPSSDDELSLVPILITDSTCETTENPDQPNSVKFTWQHIDNRPAVRLSSSRNIFTNPYTLPFT